MLKLMRKHATGWMIKIIFGAIIVVFVGFGVGTLAQKEKPIAEIGDYKISLREYREAYNKTLDFYKILYKDKFDDNMLKELKMKEKVMDDLVDKYLLLMKADELGLKVSDQEFGDFINGIEGFKKDGKFNKEQYLLALRRNNLDPEKFEGPQKKSMLVQKVIKVIQDTGTFFNESDLWAGYVKEKGRVNLAYAEFDPASFKDKVNVSDKELLDLYEKEKGGYKAENTYRLKELAVNEKGPIKDDVVYMDLMKSQDMDAYGKEKGLAVSDLGEMKESDLVKRFKGLKTEDLRELKKKGEISRLIRSGEGKSYIFQLVSMEEGKDLDKNLALAKIKERIINEKAKALAKSAAEEAIKGKSLNVKRETGFIPRNSRGIPGIGEIPQEQKGILAISQSQAIYEKPLEASGKFYVFSFKEEKLPDRDEWARDKESYSRYFTAKNKDEFLKSFLTEMRAKVKPKYDVKDL